MGAKEILATLDGEITFADCVAYFAEKQGATEAKYIGFARDMLAQEGIMEFDENAIVSAGTDAGAYVMAWVWVEDEVAGVTEAEREAIL